MKLILQVTSLASLPGQYGNGTYSGQHQHRDKYPAKKRVHAYGESNSLLEAPLVPCVCEKYPKYLK